MTPKKLPESVVSEIKNVGIALFKTWFAAQGINLSSKKNFYDDLATMLADGTITQDQINTALSELEENSNKKIRLYQAKNFERFNNANLISKRLASHGLPVSPNYSVRKSARQTATFNYAAFDDGILKLKYSEKHTDYEFDYPTKSVAEKIKIVYILIVIDFNDGLVQLRYDKPGNLHLHLNDKRKPSERAYERYYEELLFNIFPELGFVDLDLEIVCNKIFNDRRIPFKIHRGVHTITNGGKQVFIYPTEDDIRDMSPEFQAASAHSGGWLAEELNGYWLSTGSDGELTQDLFMRISRKSSEIRVLRGCLEKELNYGIAKIKEIQ